jgi:4,5-DOPA dioxygenase extradiol
MYIFTCYPSTIAMDDMFPNTFTRRRVLGGLLAAGALGAGGAVVWNRRSAGSVPLQPALDVLRDLPRTDRMPAVFVGHGTPWSAIRPGPFTETWAEVGRRLPTPDAILMVSAHWLTRGGCLVTANETPRMNYDMYGFPEEMYAIRYPAPGAPGLAEDVAEAIRPGTPVAPDDEWGFDHGTWLPLMYMFPGGPVPLVQLSIDYSRPPAFHYELASYLRDLRSRGVLIMGSGNLVHNLLQRGSAGLPPFAWAEEFDTTITRFIREGDHQAAVRFLDLGAVASAAHPTYDHFLPLLYVLGVHADGDSVTTFNEGFQEPSVSMKSFVIV